MVSLTLTLTLNPKPSPNPNEAHDAWLALLPSAEQDALTDELAEGGDGAREAVLTRQLEP